MHARQRPAGVLRRGGSMPTAPIAAVSLIAGFAVADASGVRALGGIVLLAAVAWCAWRWRRQAGIGVAGLLVALYAAAFAASHVLGDALGAWPAVFTVAAVVGLAAWILADAPSVRRLGGPGPDAAASWRPTRAGSQR